VREVYAWPNEKIREELGRIHNSMVQENRVFSPQEQDLVHTIAFFFEPKVYPKARLRAAKIIVKHMLK
jgi:hypothetical protein